MTRRPSLALGLAPFVLALLAGCGGGARPQAAAEVVVALAPVIDTALARPVLASGLLAARHEVPLAFDVPGIVARVDVEEGQAVAPGRLLAVLDRTPIDALVARAQAGLDKAERDLARVRGLRADSVVTQELYENAQTARDVAASDLRAARFSQQHAAIIAPGRGTVLRRMAEPGQTVGAGVPVLYFGPAGEPQVVRVGLPDRDVVHVAVGDPADVRFDAHPDRTWSARVTRVGAAAAPGVGTVEVEVELAEPVTLGDGGALASGLVGSVTLRPRHAQAVKLVPVEALVEGDGEQATVWSLDATGRPVRHAVRIGSITGDRAAIASGLEGVARVVGAGASDVTADSHVRVATPGR